MALSQWRVFCVTENKHVHGLSRTRLTECPNNPAHTITDAKTVLVQPTDRESALQSIVTTLDEHVVVDDNGDVVHV
jgi:hypothetical protein